MRTLLLIFFLGCLGLTWGYAQADSASFAEFYEKQTVYLRGSRLLYNGIKIRPSPVLYDFSPAGLAEFRASRKSNHLFLATYGAAIGLLVGSMSSRNLRTSQLLFAGCAVGTAFSIHFAIRSQNKLHKSIWLRNRDVLKRRF